MRPFVLFEEGDESDKVGVDLVRGNPAHGRVEAIALAQTTHALELPDELLITLELRQEAAVEHDRFHAAQGHVAALPVFRDRVQEVEHRSGAVQTVVTLSHGFVVVCGILHGTCSYCVCVWVNLLLDKYTMRQTKCKPLARLFG